MPSPARTPLEVDRDCREDPYAAPQGMLSSLQSWWKESGWPGMGLFGESYLLFSVGTLKPLWEALFPTCFVYQQSCSERALKSLGYSVVLGVIFGMLLLGTMSNFIGRRKGSILTALIMCTGAWGLTLVSLVSSSTDQISSSATMVNTMSFFMFVFGVGVGGEYPLSASSASERAMDELRQRMKQEEQEQGRDGTYQPPLVQDTYAAGEQEQTLMNDGLMKPSTTATAAPNFPISLHPPIRRGRRVQMVFAMQGMGIFFNSILMTLLLWVTRHKSGYNPYYNSNNNSTLGQYYSSNSLLWIWRLLYIVAALILSYVVVSRLRHLSESPVWQQDRRQRNQSLKKLENSNPVTHKVIFPHQPLDAPTTHGRPLDAPGAILRSVSSVSSLSTPSVVQSDEDYLEIQAMPTIEDDELELQVTQQSHFPLLLKYYGVRLMGASLSWLLWDVAFYGNKLFQSVFLLALVGNQTTLLEFSGAALLNAFVALLGYFAAAQLIDHPRIGRLGLQHYGFLITGTLFLGCGFLYQHLSTTWLVILYLGSSFFGQCGPNATTFVLSAEIFPTEMRTMCHGIAAAAGKVGALLAAIVFQTHLREEDLFLWSGYASFAACLVTFWTLPETNMLDLYEVDKKWHLILEGRKGEYRGDANLPQYLSFYERQKLHRHFKPQPVMDDHAIY